MPETTTIDHRIQFILFGRRLDRYPRRFVSREALAEIIRGRPSESAQRADELATVVDGLGMGIVGHGEILEVQR